MIDDYNDYDWLIELLIQLVWFVSRVRIKIRIKLVEFFFRLGDALDSIIRQTKPLDSAGDVKPDLDEHKISEIYEE